MKQSKYKEKLRLLCYTGAEAARACDIPYWKFHRYMKGSLPISTPHEQKIEDLIKGGRNKKWHDRAIELQKLSINDMQRKKS